jgi:hypothetical protein
LRDLEKLEDSRIPKRNRSRDLSILDWKLVEAHEDYLDIQVDFKQTSDISEGG